MRGELRAGSRICPPPPAGAQPGCSFTGPPLHRGAKTAGPLPRPGLQGPALAAARRANCVLIAMPGAGKTTVGAVASRLLGKAFVDTDALITAETGRTPAQIIAGEGEAAFRALESRVVARVARQTGQLIATGGGTVTRPENMRRLRRGGVVLFMERQLALLAADGRPLSQSGAALRRLYRARLPLYLQYCDLRFANDQTIETAARRAEEAFYAYFAAAGAPGRPGAARLPRR